MTVSVVNNRVQYAADGVLDTFAYTFKVFADADLKVYVDSDLKVLATDYTVTGAGSESGGNVIFTTPPANGTAVTILRELSITQEVDYTPYDQFPAETHEQALDRLTFIGQQHLEQLGRCMQLPETSPITFPPFVIPELAADRANKIVTFSADGTEIIVGQELGTWRGDWLTATGYNNRDIFKDPATDDVYFVKEAHTSTSIAADLAGGKIELVADVSAVIAHKDAAAASAAAAATSETNAAASASAASSSASAAATSAANAATSETAAGVQATNAATSATAASTSESGAAASEAGAAVWEAKAERWAEEAEDVEVETGLYSAKHWAAKALANSKDFIAGGDTPSSFSGESKNHLRVNIAADAVEFFDPRPTITVHTSSGTHNINSATKWMRVIVTGGGGGGGKDTTSGETGTAGCAGGTAIKVLAKTSVSATITVGSGGAGATSATGGTGGSSSFADGTVTVSATGGSGGSNYGAYGEGGIGSGGDINLRGGAGLALTGISGGRIPGGSSYWGGNSSASNEVYGSGGVSTQGSDGYDGSDGVVVVEEYK